MKYVGLKEFGGIENLTIKETEIPVNFLIFIILINIKYIFN